VAGENVVAPPGTAEVLARVGEEATMASERRLVGIDLGVKRHADVTEIRQNLALGSVMSAIDVERVE
jgi:hypothetical protein